MQPRSRQASKPRPQQRLGNHPPPPSRRPWTARHSHIAAREGDGSSPSGAPRGGNIGAATPARQPNGQRRRYLTRRRNSVLRHPANTGPGQPRKRKGLKEKGDACRAGGSCSRDGRMAAPMNEGSVLPTQEWNRSTRCRGSAKSA